MAQLPICECKVSSLKSAAVVETVLSTMKHDHLCCLWHQSQENWILAIWPYCLLVFVQTCQKIQKLFSFHIYIYIYVYLYTYLFFFLRVSHPTPSFKGQNELWLAKVFGSVHFLQGVQTPVTDLEVSGEASDAQLEIVDMLVGYSFITRNASDIWLYLFG